MVVQGVIHPTIKIMGFLTDAIYKRQPLTYSHVNKSEAFCFFFVSSTHHTLHTLVIFPTYRPLRMRLKGRSLKFQPLKSIRLMDQLIDLPLKAPLQ